MNDPEVVYLIHHRGHSYLATLVKQEGLEGHFRLLKIHESFVGGLPLSYNGSVGFTLNDMPDLSGTVVVKDLTGMQPLTSERASSKALNSRMDWLTLLGMVVFGAAIITAAVLLIL